MFALNASAAAPKLVPIPAREHGYSNFETTVISTKEAYIEFLKEGSQAAGLDWNERTMFVRALSGARLDFGRQSLVLIRHTEGSVSVRVEFEVGGIRRGRLQCKLTRTEPEVGTDDLAAYCFAIVVDRDDVRTVEVQLAGDKTAGFVAEQEIAKFPIVLRTDADEGPGPDGGYGEVKANDPAVVAAARFAVKSMAEKTKGLRLIRVTSAGQQVVAGINYKVELLVSDRSSGKAVRRTAEAVVYRNLDDEYSLTSWTWQEK